MQITKLFSSLLTAFGLGRNEQPGPTQMIDPNSIAFTTPTLSNDLAELEPVTAEPAGTALVFHEDEWTQIEFFPRSQLAEVQRLLTEYKPFEQSNRMKVGWRNVFVRRMERCPVISASDPVETLRNVVGGIAGPGPILHSSGTYIGRVKNGFSLSIGQSVSLYGYSHSNSIPVLGAHVGPNPDDSKLAEAFAKLNLSHGVILVDWRAQMVLVSVDRDGQIEVWRP